MNKVLKFILIIGYLVLIISTIYMVIKDIRTPFIRNFTTDRNMTLLITILFVAIPSYSLHRLLKHLGIQKSPGFALCFVPIYAWSVMIYTNKFEKNKILESNTIVPAVVNGFAHMHFSTSFSPSITVNYYDLDQNKHQGTYAVKHITSFSIGDTVLVRYAVSRPDISRIFKSKPTSMEIRNCCPVVFEEDSINTSKNDTIEYLNIIK